MYLKEGATKNFLIIDAAMNDLLRPAIYDAEHEFLPVSELKIMTLKWLQILWDLYVRVLMYFQKYNPPKNDKW